MVALESISSSNKNVDSLVKSQTGQLIIIGGATGIFFTGGDQARFDSAACSTRFWY